MQNTINWITAVFAQVATLYNNEQIKIEISEIKVWNTQDPYSTTSSTDALNQFGAENPTFNGDLASLYALGGNNTGGLAWVEVLCFKGYNYAYMNVSSNYNDVPTFSWTVEVITHETGHNMGSKHTHACAWNGNNTQIDDCGNKYYHDNGNAVEGDACYDSSSEIIPVSGTIMSYCHLLSGVGIDLSNGFGTQPGNLIRDRYNNASCLTDCVNGVPISDFKAESVNICANTNVKFIDLSTNSPNQWNWTFEGGTPANSTEKNPTVSWNSAGTYTVSLTTSNIQGAGNTETKTGYITVKPGSGFTYCSWSTEVQGNYDLGVDRVQFNSIDNSDTEGNDQNVKNFICIHSTEVNSGSTYSLTVDVGDNYGYNSYDGARCKVYIDYNGDGVYDINEKVYDGTDLISPHQIDITIPTEEIECNKLIGMRVYTYLNYVSPDDACTPSDLGEAEDYGIIIRCVPVSDFVAKLVNNNPNGTHDFGFRDSEVTYQFTDISTNNPTSWSWTFEGGNPATSTEQNPVVTWSQVGDFNVSLTASNNVGTGTTTIKNNFMNIALAIELKDFSGNQKGDFIDLTWRAITEANNNFTLYHSIDGVNFNFLTDVKTSDNSVEAKTYNYLHVQPKPGVNYYKLTQTDLAGTEVILKTISVNFITGKNKFSVVPNPINFDILSIDCMSNRTKSIELQVIDINGKVISDNKMELKEGIQKIKIPMREVRSGVYFVRIRHENKVDYLEFVKL